MAWSTESKSERREWTIRLRSYYLEFLAAGALIVLGLVVGLSGECIGSLAPGEGEVCSILGVHVSELLANSLPYGLMLVGVILLFATFLAWFRSTAPAETRRSTTS